MWKVSHIHISLNEWNQLLVVRPAKPFTFLFWLPALKWQTEASWKVSSWVKKRMLDAGLKVEEKKAGNDDRRMCPLLLLMRVIGKDGGKKRKKNEKELRDLTEREGKIMTTTSSSMMMLMMWRSKWTKQQSKEVKVNKWQDLLPLSREVSVKASKRSLEYISFAFFLSRRSWVWRVFTPTFESMRCWRKNEQHEERREDTKE